MRFAFCLLLAGVAAMGQTPRPATEDSLAQQRAAIERQRESVKRQAAGASNPTASFFTVPWTEPLSKPTPALATEAEAPPAAECEPVPEDQIGPLVEEISKREGLTPDLLRAVIEKESSYLPCAVSSAGAEGLMQLMPETAAGLGVENSFDTRQNVDGGARYLKQLLDRYDGNLPLALAAYNAGPARADNSANFPLPVETSNYIAEIMRKLGGSPPPK